MNYKLMLFKINNINYVNNIILTLTRKNIFYKLYSDNNNNNCYVFNYNQRYNDCDKIYLNLKNNDTIPINNNKMINNQQYLKELLSKPMY